MKIMRFSPFKVSFKRLLPLVSLGIGLLGFQSCTTTQATDTVRDRTAIKKVLNRQKEAWNRGDIEAYMEGYLKDSSLTFVGASGVNRGYNTVLNRYLKHYPTPAIMGQLDFTNLEFIPAGEGFYLVIGKFILNRKTEDAQGYFTLLWKKEAEGWRIINDHTS